MKSKPRTHHKTGPARKVPRQRDRYRDLAHSAALGAAYGVGRLMADVIEAIGKSSL
jgi:hypothetical protein